MMTICNGVGTGIASRYLGIAVCMLGLTVATLKTAEAAPSAFGSNYYEFVQVNDPFIGANNDWVTANAAANALTFSGMSGHLATISSQAENDFLYGMVSGRFSEFKGAWLGGMAPNGWLAGPESGQGFGYTNWGGVEPNNSGYAYMNIGVLFAGIGSGKWADDSGVQGVPDPTRDPVVGYFVEYERVAPVPEPETYAMLLAGLGLLGAVARRRKQESAA